MKTRIFLRAALGLSIGLLALPADVLAGRGGGRGGGGGGMSRGGGGGGGAGMSRGGGGGGAAGGRGGGMDGGGFGGGGQGGAGHSPSFSQPRPGAGGSPYGGRNPYASNGGAGAAGAGRGVNGNNPNAGAAAAANRNQGQLPNSGAAAVGAGAANRNQNPNAGAAAAGATAANRNQNPYPNAGAAAAGAGAANRNNANQFPNAGAAAAGAGVANRNNANQFSNAGAAAAGADVANRNNANQVSNAGAAAAGAAYANRNQYDQFHPGMAGGYWNGNYGAPGLAAYGGIPVAAPAFGYGAAYANPYAGAVGGGAPATAHGYGQPLNTAAAPPADAPADPQMNPAVQARDAFQAGDYATAMQLTQQALAQMPNDVSLNEFLALVLFAQGNYEQAAAPLYAVLSAGPGWDWTTLIGNYSDAGVYTTQLRGLEAFVKANPKSAKGDFVLAYHYITQGQPQAAIKPLKNVVALQPDDALSAHLLSTLQPTPPDAVPAPASSSNLFGVWVARGPANAGITLTLGDGGEFSWTYAAAGKPPKTLKGQYMLENGVLTLTSADAPQGPLAGKVASPDEKHLSFKAIGAPANDPGLQFTR